MGRTSENWQFEEMHRAARDRMQTFDAERVQLLARAQVGDVAALTTLHDVYALRLPLVEAKLHMTLPWMEVR